MSDIPPLPFSTDPLTIEELDQISIYTGFPPNSEIIKDRVQNFSGVFLATTREYLWYIAKMDEKLYNYGISDNRDVIQVEDIKFSENKSASSGFQSIRNDYLSRLKKILNLTSDNQSLSFFPLGVQSFR